MSTAIDTASIAESRLLDRIDVRPFVDTLRARWWVLPVTIVVAVGLLWAQESDLQSTPDAYSLTRTFEVADPLPSLALVGLDPAAIRAVPDLESQVIVLRGDDVRQRVAATLGYEPSVSIARSMPTFSLIDTTDADGRSTFTFRSAGIPTMIFTCSETVRDRCPDVLDAYVAEAAQLRTEALQAGLSRGKDLLAASLSATPDDARLRQQIAAVDALMADATPSYRLVATEEQTFGATVTTVSPRTYVFGAAAGLLIGLLIVLQWSLVDNTIRSVYRLRRAVGHARVLGSLRQDPSSLDSRLTSAALSALAGAGPVRLVPLSPLAAGRTLPDSATATAALSDTIPAPSTSADVIVVQRGVDRVSVLVSALEGLRVAGHRVAGVVLLD